MRSGRHHTGQARTNRRTTSYKIELDRSLGAWMHVKFMTCVRDVIDYAVVLLIEENERVNTVRVYYGAHGVNEVHHYSRRDGKQAARVFHGGTLGEGMRAAIDEVEGSYRSMARGWRT